MIISRYPYHLILACCLSLVVASSTGSSSLAVQQDTQEQQAEDSQRERRNSRRGLRDSFAALLNGSSVSRADASFLKVFEPVVAKTTAATVKIKGNLKGRPVTVALGAIVDSAGFVLTKQSELLSPITCELSDGRVLPADVYGVHKETDLVLLKVDADSLPVVSWSTEPAPPVGSWLATVSQESSPLAVGIVGVGPRPIPSQRGYMGVNLEQADGGVRIIIVNADTPAEAAGFKVGDLVIRVNDQEIDTVQKLMTTVQGHLPGDEISVTVIRDEKQIELLIELGVYEEANPQLDRSNQQNAMGSSLSRRRHDFPMAIQHDGAISKDDCGGPVVDISGSVVGINIARAGRVASLMLPASLIIPLIDELKSGQLAPALVNKDRIDEIKQTLESLDKILSQAPVGSVAMEDRLQELQEIEDKVNQELQETRERLQKAVEERIRAEIKIGDASERLEAARREKKALEQELNRLVTGAK